MEIYKFHKFIILFINILAFNFIINSLHAQNINNIIGNQDWITRQLQNKIEEDFRLREKTNIKKELERKSQEDESLYKKSSLISKKNTQCFPVKFINLIDANLLSKRQQKKLISPFIGKCVDVNLLTEIVAKFQKYYKDNGYVASRVFVPKQNIQSGNLDLKILEGKIDEIIINDNKFIDKIQEFSAFGFIEGEILNIYDIDQAIYQMNRLQSNNAIMKIEPSSKEGEAKIYIKNQREFPIRASVNYDNLGNEFTGLYRTNFSVNFDNFLFINDNINLSYATNLNDNPKVRGIKSYSAGISIPYRYNTVYYDYSRTEFRGTNYGVSGLARTDGFSQRSNLTLDRTLIKEGNFRLSTNLSLATKTSASYLNNKKLEIYERKLTVGNIGFTISNYFGNDINLYVKPSYFKGLKLLNANKDKANLDNKVPRAQFDYYKIYASISKKLTIPKFISKFEIPFTIATEMDSQYSKQTLYGSEQFSVGGYYSVRGFLENYINGDSGYYFRNKFNFNIGSIFASFLNDKSHNFLVKNLTYFNKFALEPFYDYGYVKNKYADDGSDGRLASVGAKTLFNGKYFDASLTFSWGIGRSNLITSQVKENKMIYFELKTNCC